MSLPARARVGLFTTLVALAFAIPSIAFGGTFTFSDAYPMAGTTLTSQTNVGIHVVGSAEIPSPQTLVIDGVPMSVTPSYRETSWHWEGDGCDMWEVADGWDFTDATLVGYQTLGDGLHQVECRITDAEGSQASQGWSFTMAQAPSISAGSVWPSASSATPSATPTIRIPFTDNGGSHTCTLVVGGQSVSTTLVGSEFRGTVPQPLTAGSTVSATATITDEGGRSASYTWSFSVFSASQVSAVFSPADGQVVGSRPYVSCTVSSAVAVTSVEIRVDGVLGSTGVPSKIDATHWRFGYYPYLADGLHVVVANATVSGTSVGFTSSFRVNEAPAIYGLTPGNGARTDEARPTLIVNYGDNAPSTRVVQMQLDGIEVTPTVGEYSVTYQPASALTLDATHTAWVSIRDAAGNETSRTWSFWVDKYGPMAISSCTSCHAAYPVAHEQRNCDPACHSSSGAGPGCAGSGCHGHDFSYCSDCHYGVESSRHEAASGYPHVTTTSFGDCGKCHSSSLSREHNRYTTATGAELDCLTCHGAAASAAVKNAIATNNTSCVACHPKANHEALHVSPTNSTCFGAGCHPATKNLADVHALYAGTGSEHPQYADSCALCHKNPAVNTATSGTSCTPACHDGSTHSEYSQKHSTAGADPKCTNCHGTNLATVHKAGSNDWSRCDLCHASRSNWSKTGDCAGCHGSGHPHPAAAITGVQAGDGHLCTECHSTDIVVEHSKATSAGSADACATCHADGGARSKITGAWDLSCTTAACHGEASAQPMHSTYCGGCHENENTDFSVKQTNFAAPTVTKAKCLACHGTGITNAGSYKVGRRWVSYRHLSHNATDECAGCHYWEPRRTEFYTHTVKGAYGFFASVDSTSPAPARAHSVHVNGSWAAPLEFAPQIYCRNCHAAAACGSCHEVATMPAAHANHGTQATQTVLAAPGAASYTAPKAALVPETRSCTAVACHGSSATEVPTCTSCHADRSVKHW